MSLQYYILPGAKVGKDCTIGWNVVVTEGGVVGDRCNIQNNTEIYYGVTLEDDVFVGPHVCFTNDLTPRAYDPKPTKKMVKTLVKRGASIGANSTIICGITIGKYACVGAGSVVTKDVPDNTLVYGNPARVIRKIKKDNLWR